MAQEDGEYRVCFRSTDSKQKFVSFQMQSGAKEETQETATAGNLYFKMIVEITFH